MRKTIVVTSVFFAATLVLSGISCTEEKPAGMKSSGAAPAEMSAGEDIYIKTCQSCHGKGGRGDIGPDLTNKEWKYGGSDEDLYTSIAEGRPGGMPGWGNSLGEEKIKKVITYIKSLNK